MQLRALSTLILLSACNAAPDKTLDPPPDPVKRASNTYAVDVEPYGHCFDVGAPCGPEVTTSCCEGLFCSTDLSAYGPGNCTGPQVDGSFCIEDAHCASGRCFSNVCADPSCRDHGAECYDDPASCCPGLFCLQDVGAYGVALCAPPQAAGSFCFEHAACASYNCVDNVCQ